MAGDARLSTALPSHPKTKKLKKRLKAEGCWSLVCLILWTADNRHGGDLTGMTDEDIELTSEWAGAEGTFVQTLVELRFLDGSPEKYRVHDWAEHQPWASAHDQRVEAARKAATARWGSANGIRGASGAHAPRKPPGNAPNPTQPDPTQEPRGAPRQTASEALAIPVLKMVGLPATRANLDVVGQTISLLAERDGITTETAAHVLRQSAEIAQTRGEAVDRFWFEDGRFNSNGGPQPNQPEKMEADEVPDGIDTQAGQQTWDSILSHLASTLDPHIFNTWFKCTHALGSRGTEIYVAVPNAGFKGAFEKYRANIEAAALPQGVDVITPLSSGQ